MKLSDFDYNLPTGLIAQKPVYPRDHARLLVYNRQNGQIEHKNFYDLMDYLTSNDVLFLNNSKVFAARLLGHKDSGGQIEIFLLKNINHKKNIWSCLIKGRVKVGTLIILSTKLAATVLLVEDGTYEVSFNISYRKFIEKLDRIGQVPLPPYIRRDKQKKEDKNNYQTVYARENKLGSSAAPTAGLHFTASLLKKIKKKNIKVIEGTLHVGLGTFKPVTEENILDHKMHSEDIEISARAINDIIKAKNYGKRIVAVGTTSCRILESLNKYLKVDSKTGKYIKYKGSTLKFSTDIFIYPGYKFKITDSLITNFHLPKSSLVMLVGAMIGKNNIISVYNLAVKKKYRFFSYGDAMLIV